MSRWLTALVVLAVLIVTLAGQSLGQTRSGPDAGSKVESLKVFAATGEDAGNEVDYAARRTDKPTIYVFVQADKWDRPLGRFLKVLDQELAKDRQDVAVIAVWLTDDVEKSKEYLPRAQESIKLEQTVLAVYPGDKNGPPGWSINPGAHLTAIVVEGGQTVASLGYRSVNDLEVPNVLGKLKAKP